MPASISFVTDSSPPPTALATSSNRLSNRLWGLPLRSLPSNASRAGGGGVPCCLLRPQRLQHHRTHAHVTVPTSRVPHTLCTALPMPLQLPMAHAVYDAGVFLSMQLYSAGRVAVRQLSNAVGLLGRSAAAEGVGREGLGWGQGRIRREGASEVPEAVRRAVGGGCQKRLGAVTVGYKCGWRLASGGQGLGIGWAP